MGTGLRWSGILSVIILSVFGITAVFSPCEGVENYAPTETGGIRPLYMGTSSYLVPWVSDPNLWETFTFSVTGSPVNGGTAVVENNKLKYTPSGSYTGIDSFDYQATDHAGAAVSGTAHVRIYSLLDLADTLNSSCKRDGTINGSAQLQYRPKSNMCAFYSSSNTRLTDTGAQVSMDYFVNWPSSGVTPKAVVVMIGGSALDMGLTGNATTGVADTTGGSNFVIRTAQLVADAGYITLAIDRPSDLPIAGSSDDNADADQYRISVRHAVDILTILKHINTENLDVFIAGTSRGTISAVALNLIAAGISLSSSLTSETHAARVYIEKPGVSNLQKEFVQRPVHVLWNTNDLCSTTKPGDSQTLYDHLSGVHPATTFYNSVSGGTRVTVPGNGVTNVPDVCGAFDYHGYFGIEQTAVDHITAWLDSQVSALAGNVRPKALFASIGASGGPASVDISTLTATDKKAALTYSLLNTTSSTSLGGSISLNGSIATYTPPADAGTKTDYFVYVVTDGSGGVNAGVIDVTNGAHQPVTIAGTPDYYATIQDGYDDAPSGGMVQVQAQAFTEDLILAKNRPAFLSGGYSTDYSINPGWSTVVGNVTIGGNAKVTVEKLKIK